MIRTLISIIMFLFLGIVDANEAIRQPVDDVTGIVRTESNYEDEIRADFRKGKWEQGKKLLDEAWDSYGAVSGMAEMAGWYWVHKEKYDKARYFLNRSLKDDSSNLHSRALLIKVEEQTKHWSACISLINQQLRTMPYDKNLWIKKINCYRRLGNDQEADLLLARLQRIYPNDPDVKKASAYREELKNIAITKTGTLTEKEEALRKLLLIHPNSTEYYLALSNCLLQQGKINEALDISDAGAIKFHGNLALVNKHAGILYGQGRKSEALAYYRACKSQYKMNSLTKYIEDLEEELADDAYNNDPYVMYGKIYERKHSEEILKRLLSMSMTRGYYDDALEYIHDMQKRHGRTEKLVYQEYIANKRLGNERKANKLLKEIYDLNPENEDAAFYIAQLEKLRRDSINRAMEIKNHKDSLATMERLFNEAQAFFKAKHYEFAQAKIDSALEYNPKNQEMKELRQQIRDKIYDESLVNSVYLEYQQSRQMSDAAIRGNATVQYTHIDKVRHNTWTGTLNYAGRDYEADDTETIPDDGSSGGIGVQGMVGLEHQLTDTITVSGQFGLANKFFPTVMAKVGVMRQHKHDWKFGGEFSYRLVDKNHLFVLGAKAEKTLDPFVFDGGIDAYLLFQKLNVYPSGVNRDYVINHPELQNVYVRKVSPYVSAQARARYYPVEGNKSHIYASCGLGNAPSTVLLDRALPNNFSHLSSSCGIGGTYIFNSNISAGVSGFWYTYYITRYRNYLYTNAYLTIRF